MISMWYYTNKCAKLYHLAQKPVRALDWKASAALVSLISHPSLILSLQYVAPCSRAAFCLSLLGCGFWTHSDSACSEVQSYSSCSLAWAGAEADVGSLPGKYKQKATACFCVCKLQETFGLCARFWRDQPQTKG